MPLEFTSVELLFGGLQQKTDTKSRRPDSLDTAVNLQFDKDGVLNKRRGFQFVDLGNAINRFDDDELFQHLASRRGELLILSYDYVLALGDVDAALRGADAVVYRGPNNRASLRIDFVSRPQASTTITGDDV
ncbi:MAG: hypothetical protein IPH07_23495 [Deltaproteobacteria bacterium]|nr:hypothetical protein [Deltaproteobacteria bacterium]MBK8241728.1 hypothetical protein [Deltaproteobacteria bacterium]